MKKYINPIPNGGAPLHNNRISTELQTEFWSAIEGHLKNFSRNTTGNFGIIMSGCEVVANGGGFDIAAGVVFLDGEFMRLPAAAAQSFTKYIAAAAPVNTAKLFGDGVSRDLIVDKAAELVGSAPGSGQYITISSLYSVLGNRLIDMVDDTLSKSVLSGSGGGTEDILTLPALATGKTAGYEVDCVSEWVSGGGGSAGHGSFYKILGIYKNVGGTTSIWGAVTLPIMVVSGAGAPTFQIGTTGASIKVQANFSSGEVYKIRVKVKKTEI